MAATNTKYADDGAYSFSSTRPPARLNQPAILHWQRWMAAVSRFVTDHQVGFPILLNPDEITLFVYGVRGLPRSFVITPEGAIAATIVGAINPIQFDGWLDEQGIERKY
jgi:hypothetical protein